MTGFTPKVRAIIKERALGLCEVQWECDGDRMVQIHHRRPRAAGGSRRESTNQPANGLAVCVACHQFIENFRDEARHYVWLVRQYDEPAEIRLLWRGDWALLSDDGGVEMLEAA